MPTHHEISTIRKIEIILGMMQIRATDHDHIDKLSSSSMTAISLHVIVLIRFERAGPSKGKRAVLSYDYGAIFAQKKFDF